MVDLTRASDSSNAGIAMSTIGRDLTVSYYPGSRDQQNRESRIDNSVSSDRDSYGHGTVVASVAAGRAAAGSPMRRRRAGRDPVRRQGARTARASERSGMCSPGSTG
jgi:hypothetical protein